MIHSEMPLRRMDPLGLRLNRFFGHTRARTLIPLVAAFALMLLPARPAAQESSREASQLERGRDVYERYCAGCHGLEGDGEGEAAAMLYPKPRDFVAAEYKFSSRPTPGLPTDDDLKKVIREGLRGTAMQGFPRLPEGDVDAVIEYLKTFSPRWEEFQSPPLPRPEDPWAQNEAQGIALGRDIYHVQAVCLSCHPSYVTEEEIVSISERMGFAPIPLREDAHLAVARENADGSLVFPPDFTRDPIKTGNSVGNLYRVISAGITTTAMPTWDGVLDSRQLWGLAHYIRSLSEQRPERVDAETYALRPQVDPSLPPEETWKGETFEGDEFTGGAR